MKVKNANVPSRLPEFRFFHPGDVVEKFALLASMLRALLLCTCALAHGSNAVGEKFLAENKNKEGVITLASGMQYKVLRTGDGESPTTARPNTPSTARPNRASP